MRVIIFLLTSLVCAPVFGQKSIFLENIHSGKTKKIKFKRIYSVTAGGIELTCKNFKVSGERFTFRSKIKVDSTKKVYSYRQPKIGSDISGRNALRDTLVIYHTYFIPIYKDTIITVAASDISKLEYAFSKHRDKAIRNFENGAMFNGMLMIGLPIATIATFSFGKREDGLALLGATAAVGTYLYIFSLFTRSRSYDLEKEYRIMN
jgi:hypothetical protein